jgi:hypothetical protein
MNAVITLSVGENREFFKINQLTFKRYADKVGAEFKIFNDFVIPPEFSNINDGRHFQTKAFVKKIIIIHEALNHYKKVIYLDDSCYISKDCPDLFSFVPDNFMAMHNEGMLNFCPDVSHASYNTVIKNNLKPTPIKNYFNTGMVVTSKNNQHIFSSKFAANEKLKKLFECNYGDQTYLNYIVNAEHIPYMSLGPLFNKVYIFDDDNIDYADRTRNDIINITRNKTDFSFLTNSNTSAGNINHAFIYHFVSMWNNHQRLNISKRLYELGV